MLNQGDLEYGDALSPDGAGSNREQVSSGIFSVFHVGEPGKVPAADARILDIVILDMHHRWPNLGHDSLVQAVAEIASDISPLLELAGLSLRVLSYDVRHGLVIPEGPGERFRIYIGTGGPGHLDPRRNDGLSPGTQGISEDPSWEAPLFRLFDDIMRTPETSLLAVCHTFGVLCRWSGIALPELRGEDKGGKSSGVVDNLLTDEAIRHPWFSRFSALLPDGKRFKVLDSRLYDLVPAAIPFPDGVIPIAYEASASAGKASAALTMVEFARDTGGILPRILAVNHHPEVRDRRRQLKLLNDKLAGGKVSVEWYRERADTLKAAVSNRQVEQAVMLTSQYSLLAPLRFMIYRQVRLRASALGCGSDLHENQMLRSPSGTLDRGEESFL
jgi:hypothetical protein